MNFKKTAAIAATAGALAAISVPAMALENEFHGMYKVFGYQSNFFNGISQDFNKDPKSGFFAEQRARLQYTAKANADLKLVTHFEMDARFGGKAAGTADIDLGRLDSDATTFEIKNVYLDFNCPITGTNFKVGVQTWADSYQSLFMLADMSGAVATKKFGPATGSLAWFRFDDDTVTTAATATALANVKVGKKTADLFVVDGKYAINKDMTVGASYYNIQNDVGTTPATFELLHMAGVNADIKVGPASIKPFAAFQFGDRTATTDVEGFLAGVVSKTKVGPGAVNFSAIYLSGDDKANKEKSFTPGATASQTYFNASNMWLLVRSGQGINTSNSVLGNDLTVGGRGLIGVFAGYEGTIDKLFYNANIGYAQTAEERGAEKGTIGTEINAQVGYKLFDNLSASAAVAYAFLGDGLKSSTTNERFSAPTTANPAARMGAPDADDPYAVNLQLSYVF